MVATVQKWGNSLAVRIPRSFAKETRLSSGRAVELSIRDGELVISPVERRPFTLAELLKGVTRRNRHAEVRTGVPVGRETW